jgi:hypothetical protein
MRTWKIEVHLTIFNDFDAEGAVKDTVTWHLIIGNDIICPSGVEIAKLGVAYLASKGTAVYYFLDIALPFALIANVLFSFILGFSDFSLRKG